MRILIEMPETGFWVLFGFLALLTVVATIEAWLRIRKLRRARREENPLDKPQTAV